MAPVHFHSSLEPGASAGWNFHSNAPSHTLRCESDSLVTTLSSPIGIHQRWTDPLRALDWMATHLGNLPTARWVGYLSYDLGRLFETLPSIAVNDLQLPLFHFSLYELDEKKGTGTFFSSVKDEKKGTGTFFSLAADSSLPELEYLNRAAKAINFIGAGDVFQVNLAQRFKTPLTIPSEQVWQNLLKNTPAAYGAFLDCGDHTIICNSPELFLQITSDRRIVTRPIKGTRPRMPGMQEELLHSVKDQAELNMIVDLERNDLGRVCEIGSVRVTQPRTIETHPTLYHGVATIAGKLKLDVTFIDLLRATFPGGSITGAPKIRAMQIIEELEPVRRGPYCGAIGYLAADGSMQFNVAIRTIIVKDGFAYVPVGGGIVADSDPRAEYEETLTKAAAMFQALNLSNGRDTDAVADKIFT